MSNTILNTPYEELKTWQGAISSLVGFFVIIIGALWNFHLNRRRDAKLRQEEAVSVAAALYGEILLLRRELARLARAVANANVMGQPAIDEHFMEAFTLSESIIYKALAPKIGLLSADLVVSITGFYKNFQEAKTWLPLLLERAGRGYSYSASVVLKPACSGVVDILPTLRAIEGMARITKPVEELDLGYAIDVIECDQRMQALASNS